MLFFVFTYIGSSILQTFLRLHVLKNDFCRFLSSFLNSLSLNFTITSSVVELVAFAVEIKNACGVKKILA